MDGRVFVVISTAPYALRSGVKSVGLCKACLRAVSVSESPQWCVAGRFLFYCSETYDVKLTVLTILSVQFCGIEYIHVVV